MRYDDVDVKTHMRTKDAIKVAQEVFSAENTISQVRATFLTIEDETNHIDITVFVDGGREAESATIPRLIEFMRRVRDVPVEFMVLPTALAEQHQHQAEMLVYSRD